MENTVSRRVGRYRSVYSAAILASLMAVAPARAQTLATWSDAVDGDWSDPAKWSIGPAYPNNGQPDPSDTYEVLLGSLGSAYTVSLDASVTVTQLQLESVYPELRLISGGDLTVLNNIDLGDATLRLMGGAIRDTHIGGGKILVDGPNEVSLLDGVTLATALESRVWPTTLEIQNGLTLDGGTMLFAPDRQPGAVACRSAFFG